MTSPDEHLATEAPTRVRYVVLGWLCLAATLAYIHRGCLAVPATRIQEDLALDNDQMGWILSAFFAGYAAFQLVSGWLGERWGSRAALALFAALWSAATALLAFADGFAWLLTCQLANGIAQAGIFPCSVLSISRWFPVTQRAFPSGLLGSFMSVGGVITTALTGFLLGYLTWPYVFLLLSIPGFLWAAGFYAWFRDRPEQHRSVNSAELAVIRGGSSELAEPAAAAASTPTPWRKILINRQMALICTQQFFRAAVFVFYMTWFPTFLQKTRGVSVEDSGYLASFPLLAIVLGSMLGGAASDWIQARTGRRQLSRQGLAVGGLVSCAALLLLAYGIEDAFWGVVVITLSAFCHGIVGPVGYTITIDLGGKHVSTVFSTMNMAGNIGGALCPKLVAWLVAATGNWNVVLWQFAILYGLAAVCWLCIDPDRSIVQDKDPKPAL